MSRQLYTSLCCLTCYVILFYYKTPKMKAIPCVTCLRDIYVVNNKFKLLWKSNKKTKRIRIIDFRKVTCLMKVTVFMKKIFTFSIENVNNKTFSTMFQHYVTFRELAHCLKSVPSFNYLFRWKILSNPIIKIKIISVFFEISVGWEIIVCNSLHCRLKFLSMSVLFTTMKLYYFLTKNNSNRFKNPHY